jgi:uncharacterized protein YjhX (UPF0386 family)
MFVSKGQIGGRYAICPESSNKVAEVTCVAIEGKTASFVLSHGTSVFRMVDFRYKLLNSVDERTIVFPFYKGCPVEIRREGGEGGTKVTHVTKIKSGEISVDCTTDTFSFEDKRIVQTCSFPVTLGTLIRASGQLAIVTALTTESISYRVVELSQGCLQYGHFKFCLRDFGENEAPYA